MAFYNDLSPCLYFGQEESYKLIAVGWLDAEHNYASGSVDELFTNKLFELLHKPWAPFYLLGFAECPFCQLQSHKITFHGTSIIVGSLNLFIPGQGYLYAAPSLIAHYILEHGYAPPQEFCDAVLHCPPMGSPEYFQAIVANGPESFVEEI